MKIHSITRHKNLWQMFLKDVSIKDVKRFEKIITSYGLKRNKIRELRSRNLLPKELRKEYDRKSVNMKFGRLNNHADMNFQKTIKSLIISWNRNDLDGYEFCSLLVSNM